MKRAGILLCVLGLFWGISVHAETYQDFEYSVNGTNATITKYTGTDPEIVVPETIEGYTVTGIGDWAFSGHTNLASVTFPDSITTIGDFIFYECILTTIRIPQNVSSMGEQMFFAAGRLTSIEVDERNPYFASLDGVLFNKNLTRLLWFPEAREGEYTVPSSVTELAIYAFDSSKLTKVVVRGNITKIDSYVFGWTNIESITLPDTLQRLDARPFGGSNSLTDIYFEGTEAQWNTVDKDEAWNDQLEHDLQVHFITFGEPDFILPSDTRVIKESAFENTDMIIAYIPDTCTEIGDFAFKNCRDLTRIRIPANCEIADNAFEGCGRIHIFGEAGSTAEAYCETHENCGFVAAG